ncbi:Competence protein [Limosilactobacillus gastricus PS3]|uniref:Competence protein n=1 Tax=Limosilactobacillus gastricus PS3 TaxID=1144300 RepID=H4GL50_9LACO|nr:helix-hairpin-helix domain-containing protein [Limosilactobacillus gastricus]EHS84680.1 Competence protein [Limosilactobacillus gastricus PS3]
MDIEELRERLIDLWETQRTKLILGAGVLVCIGLFCWHQKPTPVSTNSPTMMNSTVSSRVATSTTTQNGRVSIDIKGAVAHPGVYTLPKQARVKEAIEQAGGSLPTADLNQVNLAKQLTDQQVIYIPLVGEKIAGANNIAAGSSTEGDQPIVNLNTATKEQLQTITGIGEKKADKILAYRQEHGEFKSVEELKSVDGFGDKTVAKLQSSLSV